MEGYLYRICYNIWYDYQHLSKKVSALVTKQKTDIDWSQNESSEIEDLSEHTKNLAWTKALEKLGGNCKQIFEDHIEEGTKLKDLWASMGYPSYQSLIQAYYRCKKKLAGLVFEELQKINNTTLLK